MCEPQAECSPGHLEPGQLPPLRPSEHQLPSASSPSLPPTSQMFAVAPANRPDVFNTPATPSPGAARRPPVFMTPTGLRLRGASLERALLPCWVSGVRRRPRAHRGSGRNFENESQLKPVGDSRPACGRASGAFRGCHRDRGHRVQRRLEDRQSQCSPGKAEAMDSTPRAWGKPG